MNRISESRNSKLEKSDIKVNEVVVVGSGPAAVACCAELISRGIVPLVVDAAGNLDFDEDDYEKIKSKNVKTYGEDHLTYSQLKKAKLNYNEDLSLRQSFSVGGFSRVWGATLDIEENDYDKEVIEKVKELLRWSNYRDLPENCNDKVNKFIITINDRNSTFVASRAKLAINGIGENSCKHSLRCFDKCPNNAIWFAGDYITQFISLQKIEYKGNLLLVRLESKTDRVELFFENGEIISAKQVFLALGPIGSSTVLIRSGFRNDFQLRDTHTIQSALLSLRRISENKRQNALSKIWIKGSGLQGNFYIQMHLRSRIHVSRLQENLPRFIRFVWVAKLLSHFVYPILIYLNEDISGRILIDSKESHISINPELNEENKKIIKMCLVDVQKFFFSLGFYLPISQTKVGNPGDGYHCGGSLILGKHIDINGQLIGLPNVYVVDSSSLQRIPLGSITPSIMANSIKITKLAIGKKGE